jgi:hypothetical protein
MRMINFNHWFSWNADGRRLQHWVNINAHATWQSNWSRGTGVTVNQRSVDDRLTRGGPSGLTDGINVLWAYVDSDELVGGEGRNRTVDTTIFSRMLYQLSYLATRAANLKC